MHEVSTEMESPSQSKMNPVDFEFRGDGMEYFKIWIVNVLLTIVTLGIYSAWAKVRNNRYFYSNLYLGDSNFRYLAEPLTILKGRLIAVAVFVGFTFISELFPTIGLIMLSILLLAIPYFINQSLAFNHRMSAYKNIQFRFKGSYGEAFMVAYVWPLLGILTMGILYPLALVKMNQYLVNNSSYGTSKFEFGATFKDYGLIFLTMLGVGAVFGLLAWTVFSLNSQLSAVLFPIILGVMYFSLIVYFMVTTTNLLYRNIAISGHGFDATLTMSGLAKVILINAFLTVITLGLYLPAAKVRMAKYVCSCLVMQASGNLNEFSAAEKENVSVLGEEFGQVFDFA